MMASSQIKRVLKHCEKVDEGYRNMKPSGDYTHDEDMKLKAAENKGGCRALRMVLEINTRRNIE